MGTWSIWHWLIVLVIVLLLFGTKKLKNLGQDLGAAVKGFKEGIKDDQSQAAAPGSPPSAQLGTPAAPQANQTIDVEAKTKS